jgi:thiamine biosynthesis lipoprotein
VTAPATTVFPALGTTARVLVTDPSALDEAGDLLRAEVDAFDLACSRFRADSEISRLHREPGREVRVSPLLADALQAALRAAWLTGGLVDPTVGAAVCALSYDRDFAKIVNDTNDSAEVSAGPAAIPAPGWHRVLFDAERAIVVLPRGIQLDLGATAKALAADRAALAIARRTGCGVLVNLGGDLATAGLAPPGGWRIAVGDDHATAAEPTGASVEPTAIITLTDGGLATSGVARRSWRRGGRTVHHLVDPRTGDIVQPCWRTVSVAAKSCVDANAASTAAMVLASGAPAWLATRRLPARLVALDGLVGSVAGWPTDGSATRPAERAS